MYLPIAPSCSEAELEEIDNTPKTADHMYFEAKEKYNDLFPPSASPAVASASNANPIKGNMRLPKLQLKTFDGDSWQTFFDLFDSLVHRNGDLSKINL